MFHFPKITLIVTSYNQLDLLQKAVGSALAQVPPLHQIIVVDDASTDASATWLRGLEADHPNLKVVVNPHNVGLGNTRNAGMDVATGDYIAFLDGDDWLEPDAHEIWQDLLSDGQPDLCFYKFNIIHAPTGKMLPSSYTTSFMSDAILSLPQPSSDHEISQLFLLMPTVWSKLHRRAWLLETGLRFVEGLYEDIPFHVQSITKAASIRCTENKPMTYRTHPDGLLQSPSPNHFRLLDVYRELHNFMASAAADRPILRDVHARFRFRHSIFVTLDTPRVPEEMRRDFAAKVLDLPGLTDFPMVAADHERLEALRAYARVPASQ